MRALEDGRTSPSPIIRPTPSSASAILRLTSSDTVELGRKWSTGSSRDGGRYW